MKKAYLITAVAGTGKSTICKVLEDMGYEAYGIEDIPGMFGMYRKDTKEPYTDFDNRDPEKIKNAEWLCNIEKLQEVLHNQKADIAFYCGVASNTEAMVPFFDKTVVLVTTKELLHQRLSNREGQNDMGGNEASRQAVLGWKDWWENEMMQKGALTVRADGAPYEVAEKILQLLQL